MAEATAELESEAPTAAAAGEVAVPLEEEKPALERGPPQPPAPEAEEPKEASQTEDEKSTEPAVAHDGERKKKKRAGVPLSVFFKEESNVVDDLEDAERKALVELKHLVQAALANHEFTKPPPSSEEEVKPVSEKPEEPSSEASKAAVTPPVEEKKDIGGENKEVDEPTKPEEPSSPAKEPLLAASAEAENPPVVDEDGAKTVEAIEETVVPVAVAAATPPLAAQEVKENEKKTQPPPPPTKEIFLWGVPLLGGGEKTDTVLLKFLRARDFKAKEAMTMLKQTMLWREDFGVEELLREEELHMPELEKVVFMEGHDREGHPVCYNVYGGFQDEELYKKVFADEEKRGRFLRWRIQLLEKGIREQLDFSAAGVCSMVQVTDLKNSPGLGKKELRLATKRALDLLQNNYPEFVAKQVFINVPWWYMAFHRMISPFLTQRTKSKFVFAGHSRSSETLFEYIAPEQVPLRYGGLSKRGDPDFGTSDPVNEFSVKPSSKHAIEIPAPEACLVVWELRVLGWDVSYGAEFVPSAEDGYTVVVQKARKLAPADEAFVKNSFKVGEPGKIVLSVDNPTSKKKKLLYRCKTKKIAATSG